MKLAIANPPARALLLPLLLNCALLAQQPGTVSGKVVNSVTGQPVKKAVVTLRTTTGQNTYVTGSDQSGKFYFDNIQPAHYLATAQADGYSATTGSLARIVAVSAQQQVEDVEVRIPPFASISGKVLDEDGQPLAQVTVSAMRAVYTTAGKRIQTVGSVQTDDRGVYRIFDLQPGRYQLMAVSRERVMRPEQGPQVHSTVPEEVYEPVYYPGVADLSQAPLQELKPGIEWSGADFKLRRLPSYHLRGRVTGAPPPGRGGRGNSVRAERCEQEDTAWLLPLGMAPSLMGGAPLPDGRFDLAGAVSGTYCVTFWPPGPGGAAAKQIVTVKGADIDGIELAAAASFTVNGTVTIDGTPPSPMPRINVALISDTSQISVQGVMKSDGSFQIEGAYPGAYSFLMPQMGQLYVKSILYGGQDVTNGVIASLQPGTALAVTLGADPGEIDGTLQLGNVESGMPTMIAAIPEDAYAARQDMRRLTSGPAGGTFTIPNLPPGNYKIFALQTEDFGDSNNRDLLKLLEAKATSVTVHAAGHEQVSVTAISSSELEQAMGKLK